MSEWALDFRQRFGGQESSENKTYLNQLFGTDSHLSSCLQLLI